MQAGLLVGALALIGVGCTREAEETGETGTEPVGACGELGSLSLTVVGRVRDAQENWVSGAEISLEERNWNPGRVYGTAYSDAQGNFTLLADDMPVVEGCWGTAVQYWLVGQAGALTGEKPMNALFSEAYETGATQVDLGQFPLLVD